MLYQLSYSRSDSLCHRMISDGQLGAQFLSASPIGSRCGNERHVDKLTLCFGDALQHRERRV
jgi:hypothetical protein